MLSLVPLIPLTGLMNKEISTARGPSFRDCYFGCWLVEHVQTPEGCGASMGDDGFTSGRGGK